MDMATQTATLQIMNRTPEKMAHIRSQDVFAEILPAGDDPLAFNFKELRQWQYCFTDGTIKDYAIMQNYNRITLNELSNLPNFTYREREILWDAPSWEEFHDSLQKPPIAEHLYSKLLNLSVSEICDKIIDGLREGRYTQSSEFLVFIYKKTN